MKLRPALIGIASADGGSPDCCPSPPLRQTLVPRGVLCGLMLGLIATVSCIFSNVGQSLMRVRNENRARTFKDFDEYYPKGLTRLDFKIGDRFRLNKPMFLHYSITRTVYLSEPNDASGPTPSLAEYLADPAAYAFGGKNNYQIIRLAPKGTTIRLVSIKDFPSWGAITYFVFEGEDEWFRSSIFSSWKGDKPHSYTHNHEHFTKLPAR